MCIALLLKTVLHYDETLKLNQGEIKHFDEPKPLIHENEIFRHMYDQISITIEDSQEYLSVVENDLGYI